jgi:hypothetical protein
MQRVDFNALTLDALGALTSLVGPEDADALWAELERTPLPDDRRPLLEWLTGRLLRLAPVTANESTVWARAIYPLLMLAEEGQVRAWSQVPVSATLEQAGEPVELSGVLDGVLALRDALGSFARPPFLLVVETKRGLESVDPRPQLLAGLLAATASTDTPSAVRFGCFTVGHTWTFVRATIDLRGRPEMRLAWSREYAQTVEAERILAILTGIVRIGAAG